MVSQLERQNNTNGAPAVDFMALLGRCLGNFQIVERVLSTFRVTGKSDLNQLKQAIESADFSAVADVAHRFQGAASNVSASGLRELLKSAERLAQEQNRAELLMVLGRLQPEWDEFERYSESFAPAAGGQSCKPDRNSHKILETSHAGARC